MLVKTNYETKARVSELKFQGKKKSENRQPNNYYVPEMNISHLLAKQCKMSINFQTEKWDISITKQTTAHDALFLVQMNWNQSSH